MLQANAWGLKAAERPKAKTLEIQCKLPCQIYEKTSKWALFNYDMTYKSSKYKGIWDQVVIINTIAYQHVQ